MALPKKVWKINRFHKGISNVLEKGTFWFSQCLEFDFFTPFMTVANKFFKETDNGTLTNLADVYWATIFDGDEFIINKLDGKIFRHDYPDWAEVHDNSYAWGGLGLFGDEDYMYYASNSYVGRYDGSTWTDNWQSFRESNSADLCPITKFLKYICFGNHRYLAVWDTANSTWDNDRITLPKGYEIRWFVVLTDYMVISAHHDNFGSALFFWDGVSQTYNRALQLSQVRSLAGVVDKNTLYVITRDGWISVFDGVGLKKLKRFPDMELSDYIHINPDAVKVYQGLIHIAKDGGNDPEKRFQYCGIWVYNPTTNSLYLKHRLSNDAYIEQGGVTSVYSLFLNSSGNTLRVTWYGYPDGGSTSRYIIDVSNDTGSFRPYKWGAYYISQLLDDEPYRRKRFNQVILNFWKEMQDSSFARFIVKYNETETYVKKKFFCSGGGYNYFDASSYNLYGLEVGDEVVVLSGSGAGQIRHIKEIDTDINRVYVDETLYVSDNGNQYASNTYLMVTNFKKIGEIKGSEYQGKVNKMMRFNTRSKKFQIAIDIWSNAGYIGEENQGLKDISVVYIPDRIIK
jgi:ribosomal protein L24